jgi:hypothetical protein
MRGTGAPSRRILVVALAAASCAAEIAACGSSGKNSQSAGATAGFALAGGAGALAMLTTMLGSRTLAPRQVPVITLINTDTDEQLAQQAAA